MCVLLVFTLVVGGQRLGHFVSAGSRLLPRAPRLGRTGREERRLHPFNIVIRGYTSVADNVLVPFFPFGESSLKITEQQPARDLIVGLRVGEPVQEEERVALASPAGPSVAVLGNVALGRMLEGPYEKYHLLKRSSNNEVMRRPGRRGAGTAMRRRKTAESSRRDG